jgi:hypothetical protein
MKPIADGFESTLKESVIADWVTGQQLTTRARLLSKREYLDGLRQCHQNKEGDLYSIYHNMQKNNDSILHRRNPRDASQGQVILIRNATIWDGLGNIYKNHDLLLKNGLISKIGRKLKYTAKDEEQKPVRIIEAYNKIVTPGIVDMHSHAGMTLLSTLLRLERVTA